MPEHTPRSELDRLLEFHENLPEEAFVRDVMHRLQRERRRRRLILSVFGLIGAAFGLVGAVMLSGPLETLFASLPPMGTTQVALFVVAAVAFYAWFMNEDVDLSI